MKTQIITADDAAGMARAAQLLREGELVAFATETVYGLGADAMNAEAVKQIFAAKGRPADNPLISHIVEEDQLKDLVGSVPPMAKKLMDAFWPGPMTMIFKKQDCVPYETTGGLDTVAVRFPSHPVAKEMILASGTYIAAPSANTSGRPSPTTAQHVFEDMDGRIDAIIDGGQVNIGIESTIVDVTGDVPMILRPGYITKEMLEKVVGKVTIDPAIIDDNLMKGVRPKAPGMKYKHYAPKGDLTIIEGVQAAVVAKINTLVEAAQIAGKHVAVIATDETKNLYQCPIVESIGTRNNEDTIAHNLYDILRRMDDLGVDVMYSEAFSEGGLGQAIMNRLLKAAGHQVIEV